MNKPKKQVTGFTLIEVLISVVLTGMIAALAFAPVVYVVRQVTETEIAYTNETALRRTAMFMAQEIAAGLRLASTVVKVINHTELDDMADDALIVASSASAKQNLAAGSSVYRLVRNSFMNDSYVPGLYRWLLPGVLPEKVEIESLEFENGQLITPYVNQLDVSVYEASEWVPEYSGKMPAGVKFILSRGRQLGQLEANEGNFASNTSNMNTDGTLDNNGENVEYVFGFPK